MEKMRLRNLDVHSVMGLFSLLGLLRKKSLSWHSLPLQLTLNISSSNLMVSFVCFFVRLKAEKDALTTGLASDWAVSVAIYALSTAYYDFKEK